MSPLLSPVFLGQDALGTCAYMLHPFSCDRLFATLWTVAQRAPLSLGFSRQEYWSGLPCPPPEHLPIPGIELESPALQEDSLPSKPLGKPSGSPVTFHAFPAPCHSHSGYLLGVGRGYPEHGAGQCWASCLTRQPPMLTSFPLWVSVNSSLSLCWTRDIITEKYICLERIS